MRYFRAYLFLFSSPKWFINLLVGMLAPQVPVVGEMVQLGYEFDIIEAMHLHGEDRYPDFDVNRLMDYLVRGAWPYLVQLIVLVPAFLLWALLGGGCMVGLAMAFASSSNGAPDAAMVIIGLCIAGSCLILLLATLLLSLLILAPLILRAGLCQDFMAAFSWHFVRDFARRVWLEIILATIFFSVSATVLGTVGLLLCGVGIFPALGLIQFAQCHLLHQLYEVYLKRGGTPIPLKVQEAGPVPVDEANE
jgi:hypothetical protein